MSVPIKIPESPRSALSSDNNKACRGMFLFVVFQVMWLSYQSTNVVLPLQETDKSFAVDFMSVHSTEDHLFTPRRIQRPPQTTYSRSFQNAIQDAERAYYGSNITDDRVKQCLAWGGVELMETLRNSKKKHLPGESKAKLETYSHNQFDIFVASNVILQVKPNEESFLKPPRVSILLPGKDPKDKITNSRVRLASGETLLMESTRELEFVGKNLPKCDYVVDHPVFLVDADADHWNWWFFHLEQLKLFVIYALLQPELAETYMAPPPQMFYIVPEDRYNRPTTDGLELLFTDSRRLHDSVQIWNPETNLNGTETTKNYCFRDKLIWSPGATRGANILLLNKAHSKMKCFSAIVTAYVAHLKASLHIPSIPTHHAIPYQKTIPWSPKPRVVWVGRDNSMKRNPWNWQGRRIISNQEEITQFLQAKCLELGIEMDVASFYGEEGSHTSYQEQAHFVSRANIMIGVHGAGLNLAMFMPFNSVVVEIHLGTGVQKNSENTIAHLGGGHYMTWRGQQDARGNLDKETIWRHLQNAIEKWEDIHTKRSLL